MFTDCFYLVILLSQVVINFSKFLPHMFYKKTFYLFYVFYTIHLFSKFIVKLQLIVVTISVINRNHYFIL